MTSQWALGDFISITWFLIENDPKDIMQICLYLPNILNFKKYFSIRFGKMLAVSFWGFNGQFPGEGTPPQKMMLELLIMLAPDVNSKHSGWKREKSAILLQSFKINGFLKKFFINDKKIFLKDQTCHN